MADGNCEKRIMGFAFSFLGIWFFVFFFLKNWSFGVIFR